jgi:hypothetical protein
MQTRKQYFDQCDKAVLAVLGTEHSLTVSDIRKLAVNVPCRYFPIELCHWRSGGPWGLTDWHDRVSRVVYRLWRKGLIRADISGRTKRFYLA